MNLDFNADCPICLHKGLNCLFICCNKFLICEDCVMMTEVQFYSWTEDSDEDSPIRNSPVIYTQVKCGICRAVGRKNNMLIIGRMSIDNHIERCNLKYSLPRAVHRRHQLTYEQMHRQGDLRNIIARRTRIQSLRDVIQRLSTLNNRTYISSTDDPTLP